MIEIIPRYDARRFIEHFRKYSKAKAYEHFGLSFIFGKEKGYDASILAVLLTYMTSCGFSVAEIADGYIVSCTISQLTKFIKTQFEDDKIYNILSEVRKYGIDICKPLIDIGVINERHVIEYVDDFNLELTSSQSTEYFKIIDCTALLIDNSDHINNMSEEARLKSIFVTYELIDWDNRIYEMFSPNVVITHEGDMTSSPDGFNNLPKDTYINIVVRDQPNGGLASILLNTSLTKFHARKAIDSIVLGNPDIAKHITYVKSYVITDTAYNILNNNSDYLNDMKTMLVDSYLGAVNSENYSNIVNYYKENFNFKSNMDKEELVDIEAFDPNNEGTIE